VQYAGRHSRSSMRSFSAITSPLFEMNFSEKITRFVL